MPKVIYSYTPNNTWRQRFNEARESSQPSASICRPSDECRVNRKSPIAYSIPSYCTVVNCLKHRSLNLAIKSCIYFFVLLFDLTNLSREMECDRFNQKIRKVQRRYVATKSIFPIASITFEKEHLRKRLSVIFGRN